MAEEPQGQEGLFQEVGKLGRKVGGVESAEVERNRTAEALRRSCEELQAIYDGMVDGLLIADIQTKRFLRANPAMQCLTGYSQEELLSMSVMELHPSQDVPHVLETFAAQAEGRLHVFEDCPILRKDGSVFQANIATSRITYQGRSCLIGFFRDITERKQAQESLQRSEEQCRSLVEACPDAVVMSDLQGHVLFASPQTWKLLGLPDDYDLNGQSVFDYVIEEDRRRLAENMAGLVEAGVRRNTEYTSLRRDGTTVSAEASSVVVRDAAGRPKAVMAVIRDITERKRTHEALHQSLEQLQVIYDGMVEGLLITEIATKRFVRVNSSFCRMLGYSKEELLNASIKDIHPPEEVPNDLQRFQAAAEGRVSINEDRPVLRKDGSIFFADITGRRIIYDGRPCLLALFRDVTDRKQAQEALKRERQTMQHMLRASDHERQLIAYEIHDGLAQDLAAAVMHLETYEHLKEHHPSGAKATYDAGMQMLRQVHFKARRLISGVRPPILDESGLVAALAHLVHEQRMAEGPTIEFQSDVEFDRLPHVLENSIYRIAQEALSNACRHSRSEKVRVALTQECGLVRLEVQDWGVGFDPKHAGGDRFGLEGIRERARLLGGHVAIESRPGEGALVRTVLPVAGPEPTRPL
ncbi:MAG: PAS domain S-box protein [Pirellulales bacterium]|nr:PAS domain S-box protein [Pirellulales bacterium]